MNLILEAILETKNFTAILKINVDAFIKDLNLLFENPTLFAENKKRDLLKWAQDIRIGLTYTYN